MELRGPSKWPKMNGKLGLFHPCKWSHNPILIAGRGPPCKEVGYQEVG